MKEEIKNISEFLFIGEDIENLEASDLVIILGNDNIEDIASCFDKLYKAKKIKKNSKIILSGKFGKLDDQKVKECFRIRKELVNKYNYPKTMFTIESKATNIYENLLFSKKIANFSEHKKILLIAAPFALKRTKLVAYKLGYPIDKIQFFGITDTIRNINKDTWWLTMKARNRVYRELERIGKYLAKGDLEIIDYKTELSNNEISK